MSEFREHLKDVDRFLFIDDWKKLMPEMPDGATFESIRDAPREK